MSDSESLDHSPRGHGGRDRQRDRGNRPRRGGRWEYRGRGGRGDRSVRSDRSDRSDERRDYRDGDRRGQPSRVKSRYDHLPETDDQAAILRQLEFYFSDSNLAVDKHLLTLTGGHENRPVDLRSLHSFSRMKRFQPYSAVQNAVKSSSILHLDDKDGVTRIVPLDKDFTSDLQQNAKLIEERTLARSVYVKGLGREGPETQTDLEDFFLPYEAHVVRLRRVPGGQFKGDFKGSVYVEFNDQDACDKFLALEPKPMWNGKPLENVMTKAAHLEEKHEERERREQRERDREYSRSNPRQRWKPNETDRENWKLRRERDQANDRKREREEDYETQDEPSPKREKNDTTNEDDGKKPRDDADDKASAGAETKDSTLEQGAADKEIVPTEDAANGKVVHVDDADDASNLKDMDMNGAKSQNDIDVTETNAGVEDTTAE